MLPQLQTHQMDIHLFDSSPAICCSGDMSVQFSRNKLSVAILSRSNLD